MHLNTSVLNLKSLFRSSDFNGSSLWRYFWNKSDLESTRFFQNVKIGTFMGSKKKTQIYKT